MSIKVTFTPNNVEVIANAGESMVTVADRAGVRIPLGCRAGACGACQVKIGDCFIRACISHMPSGQSAITIGL